MKTCQILGVNIAVTNMDETVRYLEENIEFLRGKYITVCNGHTSVMAFEDKEYRNIQNSAILSLPDGEPLSIVSRCRGYKEAKRVTGPDLMEEMFKRGQKGNGLRHYFYGGTQETVDTLRHVLKNKFSNLQIAGMYSPPFRKLTEEEKQKDIERINDSKADIVWIGLGAPKQEKWMYEHYGKLNCVSIGVGAGFDYHAGKLRRAPVWMQKISMEWFVRLIQDPKRLWKRYLITNVKFVWYVIREKRYEMRMKNVNIEDIKVCLVGSSGGHLTHLYMLKSFWQNKERFWVTFDKEDAKSLLEDEKMYACFHPTNRSLRALIINTKLAWKILREEKPDLIVSSGAAVAVPFFYLGKLLGAKCVYIEVFDRINQFTLTGKLVYPIADAFIVQWDEMKKIYPKAINLGSIF